MAKKTKEEVAEHTEFSPETGLEVTNSANVSISSPLKTNGLISAQAKENALLEIMKPYGDKTPKDKIQKRPDGYDYVEYSYMDHVAKQNMPLYMFKVINEETIINMLSCTFTVELTNRITGNTEIGTGGTRIKISKNARLRLEKGGAVTPFDIIDLGHDKAAALTAAIKNAESRFGVCADVYNRTEELRTEDDVERYQEVFKRVPFDKKEAFNEYWRKMKCGYGEWLDAMEMKFPEVQPSEDVKFTEINNTTQVQEMPLVQAIKDELEAEEIHLTNEGVIDL